MSDKKLDNDLSLSDFLTTNHPDAHLHLAPIRQTVKDLPNMSFEQGLDIYRFIKDNNLNSVLELGFRHGVSTSYLAQGVSELQNGRVISIDREIAKSHNPNAIDLLSKLNLDKYVKLFFEPKSYNWRLMKFIEENSSPIFNLCYIDGAHTWETDGFAFFLVDKLLVKNGWIIFDDLDWTYSIVKSERGQAYAKTLTEEERTTAQISKIYDLLVKPHNHYHNFFRHGAWGFAQKK